MLNELYINDTLIESEDLFKKFKTKSDIKIKCNECNILFFYKIKKEHYINKKFLCKSCSSKGINNPFYRKTHCDSFKERLSKERKGRWYIGDKNPMYNKTNYDVWLERFGKEIADKKQEISNKKNSKSNTGISNPFYGKTHSDYTKKIIINKNKIHRDNNKNHLTEIGLSKLNLNDEKLTEILNDYKNNPNNQFSIKEKYNHDFRTIKSYWIKRNILTEEEFKKITKAKKFLGNRDLSKLVSKPEYDLFNKLKELYGENHVKSCFVIPNTCVVYDICLFNKILIEYDGYYWHKIKVGKNDKYKTELANDCGYAIYRVEENINRKIDLEKDLKNIKSLLSNSDILN